MASGNKPSSPKARSVCPLEEDHAEGRQATVTHTSIPQHLRREVLEDVDYVCSALLKGLPVHAVERCYRHGANRELSLAWVSFILRTLLAEHPKTVLRAMAACRYCYEGYCSAETGCQDQMLALLLCEALSVSGHGQSWPFEYACPIILYILNGQTVTHWSAQGSTKLTTAGKPRVQAAVICLVLCFMKHPAAVEEISPALHNTLRQSLPCMHAAFLACSTIRRTETDFDMFFWIAALQLLLSLPISLLNYCPHDDWFKETAKLPTIQAKINALEQSSGLIARSATTTNYICLNCFKFTMVDLPGCPLPLCNTCEIPKADLSYKVCKDDNMAMVCGSECFKEYWRQKGHKERCSKLTKGRNKKSEFDWRVTFKDITGEQPGSRFGL